MVGTRRLNELVASCSARLDLPPGRLFVGLSGGADSASLAFLLASAGVDVEAIHVDHGFPASDRLRAAAESIAQQLGIGISVETVNVSEGPSPEAMARDARYEVLTSAGSPVMTGHTIDDLAETFLVNLVRGTGPGGLKGIPYHRPPNVYRPMLRITRPETRELAELAGLGYLDDPMNTDVSLLRARLRMSVLPELVAMNPSVVESLAKAASIIDRDNEFLAQQARSHDLDGGIAVSLLAVLDKPVADRVVLQMLTASGAQISSRNVAKVWSVALGEALVQELGGGLTVRREGAVVVVD